LAALPQDHTYLATRRRNTSPSSILLVDSSWWPCAPRIAMAFQDAGCRVAAICPPRGHPLLKTRGVAKIWPYGAVRPLESLAAAIEGANPDLIVPCDDRAVSHLHQLYRSSEGPAGIPIRELISRSLGSPSTFDVLTSRYALMEVARELGIRVPESMPVESAADLRRWPADAASSWLLKSDGSWGGHGVRSANAEDAERLYLELKRPLSTLRFLKRFIVNRDPFWWETWRKQISAPVMAQARVAGRPANSAMACWQGRVLAQICVEVVEAQSATGPATIVKVVENAEMISAGEKLASRLGLSGMIGLDFMLEAETGDAYLIELNPRSTPLTHLKLAKGRDLVGMLAAEVSGRPPRQRPPSTDKDLIAYFPQAWLGSPDKDLLRASYQDIPWDAEGLVHELLRVPWPDRSILARIANRLAGYGPSARASKRVVFLGPPRLSSVVPLRSGGNKQPLFMVHGVDGTIDRFKNLVRKLDPDRPVYGIQAQALQRGKPALSRLEDLAAFYVGQVRELQDEGPYHIVGFSYGGLVAFEMARLLQASGAEVGLLGMMDSMAMGRPGASSAAARQSGFGGRLRQSFGRGNLFGRLGGRTRKAIYSVLTKLHRPIPRILKNATDINWFAARIYTPQAFNGRVTLLQATDTLSDGRSMDSTWQRVARGGVEIREITATHEDLLIEPQVGALANQIQDCLAKLP
jgi:thioesterase domain-containing protein